MLISPVIKTHIHVSISFRAFCIILFKNLLNATVANCSGGCVMMILYFKC